MGSGIFSELCVGAKISSFQVVTDHKALVSLLNGNNKKNKTMFSMLTRWLDPLIPFDFEVEQMPGGEKWFSGLPFETPEQRR